MDSIAKTRVRVLETASLRRYAGLTGSQKRVKESLDVLSIVAAHGELVAVQRRRRSPREDARSSPPHFLSTARAAALRLQVDHLESESALCGEVLSLLSSHSSDGEERFCWLLAATDRNRLRQLTVATILTALGMVPFRCLFLLSHRVALGQGIVVGQEGKRANGFAGKEKDKNDPFGGSQLTVRTTRAQRRSK